MLSALYENVRHFPDGKDWLKGEGLLLEPRAGVATEKVEQRNAKISKLIKESKNRFDVAKKIVTPIDISWQWIFCYGKKTVFSFKNGITAIVGENGKGKTNMLNLIQVTLYGKSYNKVSNNLTPDNEQSYVEFRFSIDGDSYCARREFVIKKGGKEMQKFSVMDAWSGEVIATGKAADDWIESVIPKSEFLISVSGEDNFIDLKSTDQKNIIKNAICDNSVMALLEAVSESRKAHKWYSDILAAAAESMVSSDDPDDEDIIRAFEDFRKARFQHTFDKAVSRLTPTKFFFDLEKAKSIAGNHKGKAVPVDDIRRLESKMKEARHALMMFGEEVTSNDDVDYLSEKVAKYQNSLDLVHKLDSLKNYNPGCWACKNRFGENAEDPSDIKKELDEIGTGCDCDTITRKLNGYKKRLEMAKYAKEYNALKENEEYASKSWAEAVVASAPSRSEVSVKANKRLTESNKRLSEKLSALSRIKTLRVSANACRKRSSVVGAAAEFYSKKAGELKTFFDFASETTFDAYKSAVDDLVEAAQCVIPISTVWNDDEFDLVVGKQGSTLPINRASGAERKLAGLAMRAALANYGIGTLDVMLVDEAMAGLDNKRKPLLLDVLQEATSKRSNVLIAVHEPIDDNRVTNVLVTSDELGKYATLTGT